MALTRGSRLGPYEVDSLLGAGGMGEVYRGRDGRIDRDVAIKVLPPSFSENPDRVNRFEREARAVAALNHPNLVTIHDVGEEKGTRFIVMELLEGSTLREILIDGPLPVRKALDYGGQIARGLAVAHDRGIVHRDLKPENIFVTLDGRLKILDFGLAKTSGESDEGIENAKTAYRDTTPGTVLGTAGYMAPEQLRGQPVDGRSDIFSFGAILYEMLSGVRPFHRESSADTTSAILKEDPPDLSRAEVQISPALDRIVRRCLEKRPGERFHSAHDVAFALEAMSGISSSTIGAAPVDEPPPRPRLLLAAIAVLVALVALAVGLLYFRAPLGKPASGLASVHLTQLTFQNGAEVFPSVSPDGTSVAYVARTSPANNDIFVQRIGGENAVNLTVDNPGDDTQPAFSPDGSRIAYRANGAAPGIYVMGATGESRRRLTDFGFNPAWTPDGASIVVGTESIEGPTSRLTVSSLHRIDVATGQSQKIESDADAVQPSVSPNGKRIAFWGLPKGTGKRVLFTIPIEGGAAVPLNDDRFFNWNPAWSPDGRYLYFSSDRGGPMNLWRLPIDEDSGEAGGPAERITVAGQYHGHFGITRDGAIVLSGGAGRNVLERYRFDPDAETPPVPEPVLSGSRVIRGASVSPDGEWLVLMILDAQEDLFVARADGSGLRRLTSDVHKDREPEWSPDGQTIYFFSDRSGRYEIWSIRRDGSSLQQLTRSTDASPGDPVISPDGTSIIVWYGSTDPAKSLAQFDLTSPLDQQTHRFVPPIDSRTAFQPIAWSSDGARLAGYDYPPGGGNPGVHVYSFEDGTYRKVASQGQFVGWLPDSRTLLIIQEDGFKLSDVETAELRPWRPRVESDRTWATLSPDGNWLYTVRADAESDLWMLSEVATTP